MKKTFLAAMALIIAFAFSACEKTETPETPTPEPTKEEMLQTAKGWIMTAATSDPAYIMADGSGNAFTDLYKNFFESYELDDIYFYKEGGALEVDPGQIGEYGYQKKETLGVWKLFSNNTKLVTKVPGFYDYDEVNNVWIMDEVNLIDITSTTLKYSFKWNVSDTKSKSIQGKRAPRATKGDDPEQYTWTFTFTAK